MTHITIPDLEPDASYVAIASQTVFDIDFPFFSAADIEVYRTPAGSADGTDPTLLTYSTHYSVTGTVGYESGYPGGTITLVTASTVGDRIYIRRRVSSQRLTDFPTSGPFQVRTLNTELDRLTAVDQDLWAGVERSLRGPDFEPRLTALPNAATRANRVLAFDADGDPTIGDYTGTAGGLFTAAGAGAVERTYLAKAREVVSVLDYGAAGNGVADDTAKIQAAIDAVETAGGGIVFLPAGQYKITATLNMPDYVVLQGEGHGFWDVIFHNRAKTWEGTTILCAGTGTRGTSAYGITGMYYGGGRRQSPTAPGTYFRLTSFMNADASGATRATKRAFSCAIKPKLSVGSAGWGVRNLRICPYMGVDGMTDYSDTSNVSLGADWDIGIAMLSSEYVTIEGVQVVGYWRIAAAAMLTFGFDEYGFSERNLIRDSKLQGHAGLVIRGGDTWSVTGTTGTSMTIRHSPEHYFPTSGTVEAPGNIIYTYTGLSYSAPSLTLTGVTPDPTGETTFRNPKRGTGFAGCQIENTFMHGLDHVSGSAATALGFTDCGQPLEMSGYPMRGVQFYNSKCQTHEKCAAFFHDVNDCFWFGGQFEGSSSHLVAAPQNTVLAAAYPTECPAADGDTGNLRLYSTLLSSIVTTLFTPRSLYDDVRTINPQARNSGEFLIEPLSGQDMIVRLPASTNSFKVQNRSGVDILRVDEDRDFVIEGTSANALQIGPASETIFGVDAGQGYQWKIGGVTRLLMFSSGNTEITAAFRPSVTNTYNCGSATQYWLNGYITSLHVGDIATIGGPVIKTGAGTPEAAVAAPVGSVFLRTDGGAGTSVYIKESGAATSAGWVGK